MSHRIERVNSLIRREISELLQRHLKDPRISAMVAVTEVDTSPDLKYARVFVSSLNRTEEKEQTISVLTTASGYLRRELTKNLKLRRIPELNFYWDDSIEHGDHILSLIDQVSSEYEG
jgi:ribosome-binding factor A